MKTNIDCMRIQMVTSNRNNIEDKQWRKMDIQIGKKENPPNPSCHLNATFF